MSEPDWSAEVRAWIVSGWDPEFSVWGPDVHEQGQQWHVVDAECEVIARCNTPEGADMVLRAVMLYNAEMERRQYEEYGRYLDPSTPTGGAADG